MPNNLILISVLHPVLFKICMVDAIMDSIGGDGLHLPEIGRIRLYLRGHK